MQALAEPPLPTGLNITALHKTFGAEVEGVDFRNMTDGAFQQVQGAIVKYGFCVFRKTGLDDASHVEFSRRFGDLDDIRPYVTDGRKLRYAFFELFDAGNVDDDGHVLGADNPRTHYSKGNAFFHVDSSFNPRRASYSLLRAAVLPPPHTGGNTEFADTRTAFETLPMALRQELIDNDYIGIHSLHHSRKRGSPDYFAELNPLDHKMHRHRIAQMHQPSGRWNLYIGSHMYHIDGLSDLESWKLTWSLMGWATRPENTVSVEWKNEGDLVIWDNTAVMHRAAGGSYEHLYARDLRRTTVHDSSSTAWGLNEHADSRPGFNSNRREQIPVS